MQKSPAQSAKAWRDKLKKDDPVHYSARVMLYNARSRSKKSGIPCSITLEHLRAIAPTKCPILGIKLTYGTDKGSSRTGAIDTSASLDRRIPELGYIPGNVSIISQKANLMKSNASKKDLLRIARWVNSPDFKLYYSKKT